MGWEWDSGFWRKAERVNAGLTRGWKSKKKGIETARTSQEEGGTKQDRGTRVDTTVYSLSALAAAELGGGEAAEGLEGSTIRLRKWERISLPSPQTHLRLTTPLTSKSPGPKDVRDRPTGLNLIVAAAGSPKLPYTIPFRKKGLSHSRKPNRPEVLPLSFSTRMRWQPPYKPMASSRIDLRLRVFTKKMFGHTWYHPTADHAFECLIVCVTKAAVQVSRSDRMKCQGIEVFIGEKITARYDGVCGLVGDPAGAFVKMRNGLVVASETVIDEPPTPLTDRATVGLRVMKCDLSGEM
ncbi:uncharacterized protein LACBIDRAFT_329300 [Laccaria bicolor S238N-H82]|uniref:Predicted protein n=1 Tax=Laccaria bicolor (strain S238N-H82 / ATCC MYA-4686) TaxID=486041 RepID=B0DHL4_LACBS|nr:uncharacterized protein LACBIDRAFT_329300 [Laccaria bicolor S238N-H82]EDR05748.1 predicted protein [Laccaria bicolor S238N-H82]|eukprot:XP_001883424.1 predicted protein [Laccaria bicolor S238N-H82]